MSDVTNIDKNSDAAFIKGIVDELNDTDIEQIVIGVRTKDGIIRTRWCGDLTIILGLSAHISHAISGDNTI